MEKIKIYGLKDPNTNQIRYVGKTKQDLSDRMNDHIYGRTSATQDSNVLKAEWIIDLLANNTKPIIVLLYEGIVNNGREEYILEATWINKYENLFNKELVYPKQPIYQYDMFGIFISKYNNILEIAQKYNLVEYQVCNLLKALNKERNAAIDFQWSFEYKECLLPLLEETPTGKTRKINAFTRRIYRYDLEGNFIDTFKSARDFIGFHHNNVYQVCCGEKKTHKGYRFSYEKVDKLEPLTKKKRKQSVCKKIARYSIEGILIKQYDGVKFIDDLKVDNGHLSRACKNNNIAYGYKWKYLE